ncbi:MAG: tetratricopeptide repeat protein [Methylococcaceae bacterium]|nr:tetratricopeptide repeat protein [Methylococcaceae bacterium]
MEIYLSEEERVEALKKWWKENARSVFAGIGLGVAVLLGWNAWQGAKDRKAQEASGLYQQLLKAVEAKQSEPAGKLAERIVQQYQGSLYATYASLFQAKIKAEAGDLAGAKSILSDLSNSVKQDALRHIVRLRLIRVLQAQGDHDGALALMAPLTPDKSGEFEKLYEELKGDSYLALNRADDALGAYKKAKQLGAQSPLLDLKMTELGGSDPESALLDALRSKAGGQPEANP